MFLDKATTAIDAVLPGGLWLRISAQAYNQSSDYAALKAELS